MKAGEKLTQNAKEAAQDASIGGNLHPIQGKHLVLDFQDPTPSALDEKVPKEQPNKEGEDGRHTIFPPPTSYLYP